MSRPQSLYRLQQVDSQFDQLNIRLHKIESMLADRTTLQQAEKRAEAAHGALETAQKALRQAETKVKDQRIKIEQTEAVLYGGRVRNPKELQDLQNEIGALKRYLATLEDNQLEAMLAVEEAQEAHQADQNFLNQTRERYESRDAELMRERALILQNTPTLENQRLAILEAVLPEDLQVYDRLRKQRSGVAVAVVKEQACSACGSTLTAALNQAAHSPTQINTCESCGRVLYAV
jgi:hypothetical protein